MAASSHSFKPGQSGNPSGRPKGIAAMAKMIAKETRDGAELVEWALKIWRDEDGDPRLRGEAHKWLTERYIGKALQHVDIDVTNERGIDMSKLSPEALAEIAAQDDGPVPSGPDDEPAG